MEVTRTCVKRLSHEDGFRGFAEICLDDEFLVRDIKIIQGRNGLFVAMPEAKLQDRCDECGGKNILDAKFCNWCGIGLEDAEFDTNPRTGKPVKSRSVSFPATREARLKINEAVLGRYLEDDKHDDYPMEIVDQ